MDNSILFPLLLTTFAGLSTGIGSAIALLSKKTSKGFLSVALGLSAGVMVYVSFVEMLPEAQKSLTAHFGESLGSWYTALAFFGGILLILIIDRLIPSYENPHEPKFMEDMDKNDATSSKKLMRMGVMTSLVIAIHNFPEGIATFIAAMTDPTIGVSIAIAIAVHNIPEGIAIAVPVYFATKSKKKAFWYSFLSGMSEPVGAVLGYFFLKPFFNEATFGILFASVAGIMVFISLDELLPTAQEYDSGHNSIYGFVIGMMIMALSLLLLM